MISVQQLGKAFQQHYIFQSVDFTVEKGEIISIVGPSGTGKSTLLKCLAGLEDITEGGLIIEGKDVTKVPANKRPVVMMFQQSLLFPHLTVLENVMYGLKFQMKSKQERQKKAQAFLEKVNMAPFANAMPHELSGGQQQRVALVRALLTQPSLLLLDEPFSSLDNELRQETRDWVKWLLKEQNSTAIFVTHDIEEAMILGDRVAVFGENKLQQIGAPMDVYHQPNSRFVAKFYCDGLMLDDTSFVHTTRLQLLAAESEEIFFLSFDGSIRNTRLKHGKLFYDVSLPALKQKITLQSDRVYQADEKIKIGIASQQDIVQLT
ncbi:Sulfate/thiosulfate import ATP-binding protein CysA [Bacillus sp. THAF10]|uniref:ABC transporter ATP-binding protein n=1 Tax=Bacillus sp. THAF10 TaxID=2587848 RepID=UPI001268D7DC|nr:ABC transporter ATP-binding protein [Bacillus sp. THAF10]QFT87879.1 Sulfate/thiosulfate import ATP-binding protein CysA [Bacillus sp. THAF10]